MGLFSTSTETAKELFKKVAQIQNAAIQENLITPKEISNAEAQAKKDNGTINHVDGLDGELMKVCPAHSITDGVLEKAQLPITSLSNAVQVDTEVLYGATKEEKLSRGQEKFIKEFISQNGKNNFAGSQIGNPTKKASFLKDLAQIRLMEAFLLAAKSIKESIAS